MNFKYLNDLSDVKDSPFGNTYGGLELKVGNNGDYYLEMMDCYGPDHFGPLTDEQVKAFHVL